MKFGVSETDLPLELTVKEASTKGHEVLLMKASQEGGVKFGASEAELPLEYVIKETPYKDFIEGRMKFGCIYDLPSVGMAELPLELAIKEAPTKGHEVLPMKAPQEGGVKFGASEAELPLEYVIKETPYKDFTEGRMKFGYIYDLPNVGKAELPLELAIEEAPTKGHEVLPMKASQEGGVNFGTSETELPLEYVIKETLYKDFTGGGMKFF
ncbi:hypothetical protein COCNU_scaffold000463G000010 [Cocos nucifera]|nr:hypothetical protein [Cocos nucifera]